MSEDGSGGEPCCQGQSWCAVTCTTEVLSRKWHTVIVHRLLDEEPLRFSDLEDGIEDISSKVLAESLDDLEDRGILERTTVQQSPRRVEYSLTEAGRDLRGVIEAMEAWGREHLEPGDPWTLA
jgi:DNA-binding HxlR family transcriptional regulator